MHPGIESVSLVSPALAGRFLPLVPTGKYRMKSWAQRKGSAWERMGIWIEKKCIQYACDTAVNENMSNEKIALWRQYEN